MRIETDMPMPELEPSSGRGELWEVRWTDRRPADCQLIYADSDPSAKGNPWFLIKRDKDRYVLAFPGYADFEVIPSMRTVVGFAEAEAGENSVRHLLLDHVIPHLRALTGAMVLHASAVATSLGAVVFAGPSGGGKSTLAASFAEHGDQLLADDFVVIEETSSGFRAVPSYPGVRLWPDSVAMFSADTPGLTPVYDGLSKRRVARWGMGLADPAPLLAVIMISSPASADAATSLHRLSAREAFISLFTNAFRMERSGGQRASEEFERFGRVAESVPAFRLDFPRDFVALKAVRLFIRDKLGLPDPHN